MAQGNRAYPGTVLAPWVRCVHLCQWGSSEAQAHSDNGHCSFGSFFFRLGYEGEFVEDRKQGWGSFFFENGDAYEEIPAFCTLKSAKPWAFAISCYLGHCETPSAGQKFG